MSLTTQAFGHDGKTYTGKDMRQLVATIFPFPATGGFVADFHAQQQGSPNATLSVQLGTAVIPASGAGLTGMYEVWNDAALTSPAFTATTTNGRKDRLILRVTAGVPALEIVQGTASGSPVEPAITGDNYLEICLVTLPVSTTNITNAMITDRRVPIGAVGGVIAATTALLPAYEPWQGTLAYDTTTGMFKVKRSGAAWQGLANVMICTNATRPTGIGEGFIIYETDTDRTFIYNGAAWTMLGAGTAPPPQMFSDTIDNGTAAAMTAFASHNNIGVAPCPLTMVVTTAMHGGFSGGTGTVALQVQDEAGANITDDWNGSGSGLVTMNFAAYMAFPGIAGKKDYAAGATMGYRLAYNITASNVYIRSQTMVQFFPKVS